MPKAAIVGSGIVGRAWAVIFARGGYQVELYDIKKEAREAAVVQVTAMVDMLSKKGLLFGQDPGKVSSLVKPADSLTAAITGAVYLQECVPEILPLKTKVFAGLDKAVTESKNKDIILGSSSSNMAISLFAKDIQARGNCIVCHPVNPPFAIPIVEMIPAVFTRPEIIQKARKIMTEIGMSPALLNKEIDGFLVNRMQYALLAEAFRLVDDGVASPEDVDTAISQGLGLRWSFMGPFQTIDLNAPGGVIDYFERYGDAISRVIKPMDNTRPWSKETVTKIHQAMRKEVPVDRRGDRLEWRNERLLNLAVHKLSQGKWDSKSGAPAVASEPLKNSRRQVKSDGKRKAVIVGSGIVGRCWAAIFARGGVKVDLFDISKEAMEKAIDEIAKLINTMHQSGLLFGQDPKVVAARVQCAPSLENAVKGACYLQECVPESKLLKTRVFSAVDSAVSKAGNKDIILASSASNLASSQFTSELKMKGNCLVCHPVNPPFAIPLVEVVPAPYTNPKVIQSAIALLKEMGLSPALLNKEIDGFLVNRMQYALLAEAFRLVDDGVASPEDVDVGISQGLGLRWSFMGPFQTIDLNAPGGVDDYFERYGSAISRVIKPMDNTRPWRKETVAKIHAAMRKEVPSDLLQARLKWRNERLLRLAVHKLVQKPGDMSAKPTGNYKIAWVTAPDQKTADSIASGVLGEKLVACVNMIPGVKSMYSWKGKLETSQEVLMLMKTKEDLVSKLITQVVKLHPYDCPEVITTAIEDGHKEYLSWVGESVSKVSK